MEGVEDDEEVPAERPARYNEPTKTKKHNPSNLGGNRTGLVMTKAEMWEGESLEIEKIEAKIPEKLYSVTEKVIDELRKAGLDDREIKMFIEHEIEERGKEATMSQYDSH